MRAALLALVLASLACSPPALDPPTHALVPRDAGPESDALDPTSYCESIVDFFCPYYVRCGRMAAVDVDACRATFLPACNARYEPTYVSLAAAGLVTLSRAGIEACRVHLADVACEQQLKDPDGPCGAMWVGQQAAGEACGFDLESFTCAPGTSCQVDTSLCGTCVTVVADGADCRADDVTCARDSACVDGVCVPRKRPGEHLGAADRCVGGAFADDEGVCRGPAYVGVGDACDVEHRCPFAAACIEGVCRQAVGVGEACSATIPCDSGGFCDAGVCRALTSQGGPCASGAECQTGVCLAAGEGDGSCSTVPSACFP